MSSSTEAIAAVSQRLEKFLLTQAEELSGWGDEAQTLHDVAAGALRGGKRLRARFLLAGFRACGGTAERADAATSVAAALEVFHAAALVHDDVIDNSDTRRGQPAAHRALAGAHAASGWTGDAEAFGRNGAILLGDLLVAGSDDLVEAGLEGLPAATAQRARAQYAQMRREVTVGQFLDIAEEAAWITAPADTHAERALRVASLKSARYSVEQPLLIGAALADADTAQRAALAAFGHPVGMAFQLRDDVLGVFGDASVTGKPAGDDLREGKRTVLVAFAREALDDDGRAALDATLGDPALDDATVERMRRVLVDTGALDRVEELIAGYIADADRALAAAPLRVDALDELRALAAASADRVT